MPRRRKRPQSASQRMRTLVEAPSFQNFVTLVIVFAAVLVGVASEDALGSLSQGWIGISGQGASFVAAGAAFVVDVVLSVGVSTVTRPKPAGELRGLVYSETPREDLVDPHEKSYPWYRRTLPLAGVSLALVIVLNVIF